MMKIVIADDDIVARGLLKAALSSHYEILEASNGIEALAAAESDDVRLILLDVVMPGMSGHEVCSQLRRNPLTCHVIVVMLTSRDSQTDIIEGLKSGADDYIVKPPKIPELLARVDSHLRRQWRELQANPLTGLPGNNEIDQVIRSLLKSGATFAICYADLNRFKSYNDCYGFMNGDRVISFTAELLTEVIAERGNPQRDFVGHIGGDDFVIVTSADRAENICAEVAERFDDGIRQFYDESDLAKGGVVTIDRSRRNSFSPILTISMAIVASAADFTHPGQIAQAAAEIKQVLKQKETGKSSYMVERRGGSQSTKQQIVGSRLAV